jgi:hypothetical protein
MRTFRWTALAVWSALAAVAVAPAAAQSVELKSSEKVKRDKNVLTADEIAERSGFMNAYDAVKALRPQFLKRSMNRTAIGSNNDGGGFGANPSPDLKPPSREGGGGMKPGSETPTYTSGRKASSTTDPMGNPRDAENIGYAVLYINELKQQSLDDLKTVKASDVLEIRFLNSSTASSRFGPGHESGALMLKTKPS